MNLNFKIFFIKALANLHPVWRAKCEHLKSQRLENWAKTPGAKEAHTKRVLERYYQNRDAKLKYQNEWVSENKERNTANAIKSIKKRQSQDPRYGIASSLNGMIIRAMRKCRPSSIVESIIGCSVSEARKHFEDKFTDGMDWLNYGRGGWELDHVIPWKKFDITKDDEKKKCYHISNLQPLWKADNIRKRDRIKITQPQTT